MNRHRITIAAVFCVVFFAALAYAQVRKQEPQPNPEDSRPELKREDQPTARPSRQEEAKPPKQERSETSKPPQQEAKPGPEQRREPSPKGQLRERSRPAGKSAHIPERQFKANFGRQHTFRANQVINQTTVVPGQTQFVYASYTFIIVDPWPAAWLFTDECYIDYVDDEYFLFDGFHPGIGIALFVVG